MADDLLIRDGMLFAALDPVGVVVTAVGDTTWTILSGNLPNEDDFVSAIYIFEEKLFASLSAANGLWSRPFPITSVEENPPVPRIITLKQNYPNPFPQRGSAFGDNPSTTISFSLQSRELVTLKIFDVRGREVATILENDRREPGLHSVVFNAENLASGVYFYKLITGHFTETKKMILIKL